MYFLIIYLLEQIYIYLCLYLLYVSFCDIILVPYELMSEWINT